jgi:hypothetical protein
LHRWRSAALNFDDMSKADLNDLIPAGVPHGLVTEQKRGSRCLDRRRMDVPDEHHACALEDQIPARR